MENIVFSHFKAFILFFINPLSDLPFQTSGGADCSDELVFAVVPQPTIELFIAWQFLGLNTFFLSRCG